MKGWALFHAEVPRQPSLREEVRWQLHRTPETRPDHGGVHATIQASRPLRLEYLTEAIQGIPVIMLRPDGEERRETLQPRLDEEERATGGGAQDARGCAAEHVDSQALCIRVLEQERREGPPHGFVEAQPAAVEEDLVYGRASYPPIQAAHALVPEDDGDAVDRTPIVVWLVALELQLALQLHADFDRLEGVGREDGSAGGDPAGNEGT